MCQRLLAFCALFSATLISPLESVAIQSGVEEPNSIARFAPAGFFGGVYVDLESILASKEYCNLPFDVILPSSFLLDRYSQAPISEFAVFVSDSTVHADGQEFEVAAAARLKNPMKPETALREIWKATPRKYSFNDLSFEAEQLEGQTVYRLPTGSFLNSKRKRAKISFTAKDGSINPKGINVGNIDAMGYVGGGKNESAILQFDGVTPESLTETEQLKLIVKANIFRTREPDNEFFKIQVFLRKPNGELSSDPMTFIGKSYETTSIVFPRNLISTSEDGTIESLDLFEDLVVDGRIDVVFKPHDENCYLGIDRNSVCVDSGESEFVAFQDDCILLAPSKSVMQNMLKGNSGSQLSTRLSDPSGKLIVMANIQGTEQKQSLDRILNSLSLAEVSKRLPNRFSISAHIDADAHVEFEFENSALATSFADDARGHIESAKEMVNAWWFF